MRRITGETISIEDFIKRAPTDGVEGFSEVKLEHDGGCSPFEAALYDLGGVDEIFHYASSFEETSLVRVDEPWEERLEPVSQALGDELGTSVLQRDGVVGFWM